MNMDSYLHKGSKSGASCKEAGTVVHGLRPTRLRHGNVERFLRELDMRLKQ